MAIINTTDNLIVNTTGTASPSDAEHINLALFSQNYSELNDQTNVKNLYGIQGYGSEKSLDFSFTRTSWEANKYPIKFWANDNDSIDSSELRFNDSSYKINSELSKNGVKNSFKTLLKSIPTLQISEIQPLARMNRWINYLMQGWSAGEKFVKLSNESSQGVLETLGNIGTYFQAIFSKLYESVKKQDASEILNLTKPVYDSVGNYDQMIMDLPYTIYTNLIMGKWLNSYTFPYISNTNYLQSSGSNGWEDMTMVGSLPEMLGEVIGGLGLDITNVPTWKITKNGIPYPEFEYSIHLFNNTISAAFCNFILVNSIVMNNMWYQDGFLKVPSCLYDVYIRNMIRLFLCTIDVTVENVGKMRTPSQQLIKAINSTRLNNTRDYKSLFKIPDAYKLTLHIKSLMPNNVNTYLYGMYIKNEIHNAEKGAETTKDIWQDILSKLDTIGNKALSAKIESEKK